MMRKIGFLAIIITSCLNTCPTCVGKITHKSPPFFSDSFYVPEQKKTLNQSSIPQEASIVEDDEENTEDNAE